MIVSAQYDGKLGEAREGRIHKVFERCGVRLAVHSPVAPGEISFGFSDVEWTSNADDTWTGLKIHVVEQERAVRLASELRACGMVVGIGSDDDLDWPEDGEDESDDNDAQKPI